MILVKWKGWKVLQKGSKDWEKKKSLVLSSFSFSHSVFKRLVLQTGKNKVKTRACLVKGLRQATIFGNRTMFSRVLFQFGKEKLGKGFFLSLTLPNNKILDWSKLKAFADNKIKVTEGMEFVLKMQKIFWEKEKMLVTSIFPFSYNVFKTLLFHCGQKLGLCGKS